ncbi:MULTISPECIES: rhodanese-like domain-containing protein [Streptococcus]|uniref:Rhodanese-like domain-containing protein n=1 Tax=Streptococcus suis TaxID=1307 RepID=A0A4T2GSW1_STRSU|nr:MULTISPECIES: rhodanese-like domain-containing protein [Streptococcus]MBM7267763.1 rhodanese-like domain-containing protein [Streptococcus suis]MBO3838085.1 rhodanese-like domain-containing protein [Streptococcus suis]MBO4114553.1 rhodanese-like domain-containing protein [Streptococcus suis]MBY0752995.1 rhodanese-like domain-containing protein [Streptococcus sp. 2018037]MDG4480191.1 rhodanese-like domain-containing protein [Streptococcus suis]
MLKQILSTILKQKESLSLQDLPKVLEDKNTKLLDVREVDEFASGHIPEAINQPLSQIDQFKGDKNKHYLIICQSGMRSQRATDYLTSQGYQAVNVQGGMNAWTGDII